MATFGFALSASLLGGTHPRARFGSVPATQAMFSRMLGLGRFLQILQAVIRRILIEVVDHIAGQHRILRVRRVPHVLVALDVTVFAHRGMQVPLHIGDSDKYAALVAGPLTSSPVGVGFTPDLLRDLRFDLGGHAPRGLVGAGPGAAIGEFLGGVDPSERDSANGAFLGRFHKIILVESQRGGGPN